MQPQVTKQMLILPACNKNFYMSKTKELRKNGRNSTLPEGGLSDTSKGAEKMGAVGGDTSNATGVPLLQVLQSHGHSMLLEGNRSLIRFAWEHC